VKVIKHCNAITGKSLSRLVVSQQTNNVAVRLLLGILKAHFDKFLVVGNCDLLFWLHGIQMNLKDTLNGIIVSNSHRETTNGLELFLVFKVDPVNVLSLFWIGISLHLKNIITKTNSSTLDVRPETNEFGTDLNLQSRTVSKSRILGENQITLSVVLQVLLLPCLDC